MVDGLTIGDVTPVLTPFVIRQGDDLVPNEIAQGSWGPTLGGQVVGGLLARSVQELVRDDEMQPARLTVEILRRVATAPVRVGASVTRTGRRMQAITAEMIQDGRLVARASALYLRRGLQPEGTYFNTPVTMPAVPEEPERFGGGLPMFIRAYGSCSVVAEGHPWAHESQRYAWVREIRDLVEGEQLTPFIRAAMAADVTSSLTNFNSQGLSFINADYTVTLSKLPEGAYVGLAALSHHSDAGIATGVATLLDARGPIGSCVSTAIANFNFVHGKFSGVQR